MDATNLEQKDTIPCSVGILTFNSEKTLRRTLESVKDFSDIIISDGGSTDGTLDIARAFGARIIEQIAKTKPGPEPRHPITDFSAEHNQLIEAAKENWYLRLDSDEYISPELHDEIAAVSRSEVTAYGYKIPMVLQSPDASITYRLPSPIYQMRFFNVSVPGAYHRKIHETYVFEDKTMEVETLKGSWFVPISKPDFATYKWAATYRLNVYHSEFPPKNFSSYINRAWLRPLRNVAGILLRMMGLYLTTPLRKIPPLYYFRNRLYSQWVTFWVVSKLYFGQHGGT